MENFILIILAIAIGYFFQRLNILPKESPIILNQFAIYICMPALILLEVPTMHFSLSIITPIVVSWIVIISTAIITFYSCKFFNFSKEITAAMMLITVLGNTSFLGIPMLDAYYGKEAMSYLVIYDQLGTFVFLATYATFIISVYSKDEKQNLSMILKKVLTFPPFLSLAIGLCLMFLNISYTKEVEHILSIFASPITPIALVAVGLQLKFKIPKEDMKPFSISLIIKLIIAPIIAIIVCYIFSWDDMASKVSIMESAMPAMITAAAMASMAGFAPRLSSAVVGYGIIASFFTTAILYSFLG